MNREIKIEEKKLLKGGWVKKKTENKYLQKKNGKYSNVMEW